MIPLVFAAALNVSSPDVVTPNRRNVVTLTGSAVLANTKPGSYRVSAHFPVSLERSEVVGDPIPSVRVSPPLLRLKEGKSRRFVAHIPVASGYSGPLYLCIMSAEPPSESKGIVFLSRSCYSRQVLSK